MPEVLPETLPQAEWKLIEKALDIFGEETDTGLWLCGEHFRRFLNTHSRCAANELVTLLFR